MAKEEPEIINNTHSTMLEIRARKQVGLCKNVWRQRNVRLYESPVQGWVFSIGTSFDGKTIVIAHEQAENHRATLETYPEVYTHN